MKPKNDDVTIYKVRLSRRLKRVLEDWLRLLAILSMMAILFGLAYACDALIVKDYLRDNW